MNENDKIKDYIKIGQQNPINAKLDEIDKEEERFNKLRIIEDLKDEGRYIYEMFNKILDETDEDKYTPEYTYYNVENNKRFTANTRNNDKLLYLQDLDNYREQVNDYRENKDVAPLYIGMIKTTRPSDNFLKQFGRGLVATTKNMLYSAGQALSATQEQVGSGLAKTAERLITNYIAENEYIKENTDINIDIEKENDEREKRYSNTLKEGHIKRMKNKEIYQIELNDKWGKGKAGFFYDLGGVGANLFLGALQHLPILGSIGVTSIYALNNFDDMLSQATEKDLLNDKDISVLLNMGIAGIHTTTQQLIENYTDLALDKTIGKTKIGQYLNNKYLKGTTGRLLKSGFSEGLEEILQNPLEYYMGRGFGVEEEKKASDLINDTLYSGLLGFIGGIIPASGKEVLNYQRNKKDILKVKSDLVGAGVDVNKAEGLTKEIYNNIAESGEQFISEFNKLYDNDTQQLKYTTIDDTIGTYLKNLSTDNQLKQEAIKDFVSNIEKDLKQAGTYSENEITNLTLLNQQQLSAIVNNLNLKNEELRELLNDTKLSIVNSLNTQKEEVEKTLKIEKKIENLKNTLKERLKKHEVYKLGKGLGYTYDNSKYLSDNERLKLEWRIQQAENDLQIQYKELEKIEKMIANKSAEAKGNIQFLDNQAIVRLFKEADVSTVIHELQHYYFNIMEKMALKGNTSAIEDMKRIEKWAGEGVLKEGLENNYKNRNEYFAMSFERYLYEGKGKANNSYINIVFDKLKNYLRSIYEAVDKIGLKIAPKREVYKFFDYYIGNKAIINNNITEDLKEKILNEHLASGDEEQQFKHYRETLNKNPSNITIDDILKIKDLEYLKNIAKKLEEAGTTRDTDFVKIIKDILEKEQESTTDRKETNEDLEKMRKLAKGNSDNSFNQTLKSLDIKIIELENERAKLHGLEVVEKDIAKKNELREQINKIQEEINKKNYNKEMLFMEIDSYRNAVNEINELSYELQNETDQKIKDELNLKIISAKNKLDEVIKEIEKQDALDYEEEKKEQAERWEKWKNVKEEQDKKFGKQEEKKEVVEKKNEQKQEEKKEVKDIKKQQQEERERINKEIIEDLENEKKQEQEKATSKDKKVNEEDKKEKIEFVYGDDVKDKTRLFEEKDENKYKKTTNKKGERYYYYNEQDPYTNERHGRKRERALYWARYRQASDEKKEFKRLINKVIGKIFFISGKYNQEVNKMVFEDSEFGRKLREINYTSIKNVYTELNNFDKNYLNNEKFTHKQKQLLLDLLIFRKTSPMGIGEKLKESITNGLDDVVNESLELRSKLIRQEKFDTYMNTQQAIDNIAEHNYNNTTALNTSLGLFGSWTTYLNALGGKNMVEQFDLTKNENEYKYKYETKTRDLIREMKEAVGGDLVEWTRAMNSKLFTIQATGENQQFQKITFRKDFNEFKNKFIDMLERQRELYSFKQGMSYNKAQFENNIDMENKIMQAIDFLNGLEFRQELDSIKGKSYNMSNEVINTFRSYMDTLLDEKQKAELNYEIENIRMKEHDKIQKMDINGWSVILASLWMKNKKTNLNMMRYFKEDYKKLKGAVDLMTEEQEKVAKLLFDSVQDREQLNPYYIAIFNKNMGQVENYFPRVSIHDINNDIFKLDMTSDDREQVMSSVQHRSDFSIPKLDVNPLLLALKHIQQTEWVINIAGKLDTTTKTFKSNEFKRDVEDRFGEGFYRALMHHLDSFNFTTKKGYVSAYSDLWNKVLGRWKGSVVNTPTVLLKQISSIGGYMEGLDKGKFLKYLFDGKNATFTMKDNKVVSGSKEEVLKFLSKYIQNRYTDYTPNVMVRDEQGKVIYNTNLKEKQDDNAREIVKELIELDPYDIRSNAEQFYNNFKNKNGFTRTIDKLLNLNDTLNLTKLGDKISVIRGGYARIMTLMETKRYTLDEAIKDFEKVTIATQQETSIKSNLNLRQKTNNLVEQQTNKFISQNFGFINKNLNYLIDNKDKELWEKSLKLTLNILGQSIMPVMAVMGGYALIDIGKDEEKKRGSLGDWLYEFFNFAILNQFGLDLILKFADLDFSDLIGNKVSYGKNIGKSVLDTVIGMPVSWYYKFAKGAYRAGKSEDY